MSNRPDGSDPVIEEIDETLDPTGAIAVTRYEILTGDRHSDENSVPFTSVRFWGHPHGEDGSIDVTKLETRTVVMQAHDAAFLAADLANPAMRA